MEADSPCKRAPIPCRILKRNPSPERNREVHLHMFSRGNEVFSINEIKHIYPNEWVAIEIAQTDEDGFAASGEVITHACDERFVWSAIKLKEGFELVYVFYTGARQKRIGAS
jgi:hypothetical protein